MKLRRRRKREEYGGEVIPSLMPDCMWWCNSVFVFFSSIRFYSLTFIISFSYWSAMWSHFTSYTSGLITCHEFNYLFLIPINCRYLIVVWSRLTLYNSGLILSRNSILWFLYKKLLSDHDMISVSLFSISLAWICFRNFLWSMLINTVI